MLKEILKESIEENTIEEGFFDDLKKKASEFILKTVAGDKVDKFLKELVDSTEKFKEDNKDVDDIEKFLSAYMFMIKIKGAKYKINPAFIQGILDGVKREGINFINNMADKK